MGRRKKDEPNDFKSEYKFDTYQKKYEEVDELPSNKNKMKILVIAMSGILVALIVMFGFAMKNKQSVQMEVVETPSVTIAPTAEPSYSEGETPVPEKEILPQYAELLVEYPDLVGWITIEGTKVDYPVVQSKDPADPHYYLRRSPERESNTEGSIFFDTRNNVMYLDRNSIIYGHNMKFGTMFGDLDQFKNHYFRQNHKTITFNTLYDEMEWEIINVMITDVSFYYIDTNIYSDEEFLAYIEDCIEKSYYENDVVIEPDDIVITLSTCINDVEDGRLVIQARLIKDDVKE